MLLRHDVDRLGRVSSASNESGSLELLLTLHALVRASISSVDMSAALSPLLYQFSHSARLASLQLEPTLAHSSLADL